MPVKILILLAVPVTLVAPGQSSSILKETYLVEEAEALQEGQMTLQDIPVELLVAHPESSNFMNAETIKKLRRHIERTGRYEPLTVRPHPTEDGKFQVINGHNRLRVLRALNHKMAHCVVWNIDDNQTRLYLATLNRLSGSDVPELRAMLLENLFTAFDNDELSSLLPDSEKQIDELIPNCIQDSRIMWRMHRQGRLCHRFPYAIMTANANNIPLHF